MPCCARPSRPTQGYVFKTVGDAFCAAFSTADGAVAAALDAQRALTAEDLVALRRRFPAPVGPHGPAHRQATQERDGDYFGRPVNRCARLEAAANGGQVLLSEATRLLVHERLPAGIGLARLRRAPAEGPAPRRACFPATGRGPAGHHQAAPDGRGVAPAGPGGRGGSGRRVGSRRCRRGPRCQSLVAPGGSHHGRRCGRQRHADARAGCRAGAAPSGRFAGAPSGAHRGVEPAALSAGRPLRRPDAADRPGRGGRARALGGVRGALRGSGRPAGRARTSRPSWCSARPAPASRRCCGASSSTRPSPACAARAEGVVTFFVPLNTYAPAAPGEPLPAPAEWLSERWQARYPRPADVGRPAGRGAHGAAARRPQRDAFLRRGRVPAAGRALEGLAAAADDRAAGQPGGLQLSQPGLQPAAVHAGPARAAGAHRGRWTMPR